MWSGQFGVLALGDFLKPLLDFFVCDVEAGCTVISQSLPRFFGEFRLCLFSLEILVNCLAHQPIWGAPLTVSNSAKTISRTVWKLH
jgi:hypothetical protein